MKRSFFSVTLILLLVLQAYAYKKQSIDITVGGKQRNMVVFTPNSLPAKSPLFIVTHGMNQDPEYQYGSDKMYEMIDTAKFVITYLRSDGNTWDIGGTKDQNFVIKTIDEMATRFDIDKERVYWSGFSMGSMLIHHCIGSMQDKIAAFAPTSGAVPAPNGYLYNDIYLGGIEVTAATIADKTAAASGAVVDFHGEGLLVELTPCAGIEKAMKAAVPNVIQVLV